MQLKSIFIYSFLLLASPIALANTPKKLFPCKTEALNRLANKYKAYPNEIYIQIDYGECLVVHGYEAEGMNMLHNLSGEGVIPAAYFVAMYTRSGGVPTTEIDPRNIDKAIKAFEYVQGLINSDTTYPNNGWRVYERIAQMELNSLYYIPQLYRHRFQHGFTALEDDYISHTSSELGRKYPETVGSLKAVIENANDCLNTPQKNHFKPANYEVHLTACQILKDEAQTLIPLEEQRLEILRKKSCSRAGLLNCEEYKTLTDEMINIVIDANTKLEKVFGDYNKMYASNN